MLQPGLRKAFQQAYFPGQVFLCDYNEDWTMEFVGELDELFEMGISRCPLE